MIDLEPHGELTVVRMVHGKANAQSTQFCRALTSCLREQAETDSRALVLTGRGNVFSAGVDLLEAVARGSDYLREFLPVLDDCFETLFTHPKPVVAAVNGHAIAGGCILAVAADRRIMSRGSGRIGIPELLVGVPFPPVALEIVRNAVDPASLESLVFTAETVDPQSALRCGLVHELVEESELLERALELAGRLARIRPEVYALTKRQLREPSLARVRAADDAAREVESIWWGADTLVSMQTYVRRTFKRA